MTRRSKLWLSGSLLFALVNAGGAVFAGLQGGAGHAMGHVVLGLLGLYVAWRFIPRAGREETQTAPLFDARLDRIQQSLDAIAVEMERVEEGQRYVAKLGQRMTENDSR